MTSPYVPDVESASPSRWRDYQNGLVRNAVRRAFENTTAFPDRLAECGLSLEAIDGVEALAELPVLSKDVLPEIQHAAPPFGGLLAVEPAALKRVFVSPGPILDPEGREPDFWGWAPALWAAGFREGDIVYNTFSYHLTPAGAMMEEALRVLDCVVVPGGVGNTEGQVELLHLTRAQRYCGTPDFLLTLLERSAEKRTEIQLSRAFVSGGPLAPSLRETFRKEYGIVVLQGYGTADVGALGFECEALAGWHVAPGRVVEVVDPSTGRPLPPGETGEVVATVDSAVYPLVRFGTGDLSSLDMESCACGRTTPRLLGFQGRVGDGVKVRGMFVHPGQIARALASIFEAPPKFDAVVTVEDHRDEILVRVEGKGPPVEAIRSRLREELKLRVEVELVPQGTLEENAPAIRDERTWT